ncbi:MAG: TetR/AcrR family transcriptional regulator [Eubacteriaceae bacterium]|nr:TetR/AcrR family transcriptional regulator [Eubacteriaceae bacterium]
MTDNPKELSLPEKKKKLKMDDVIRRAKHLFEENGFDQTSITALCKGVMISKSSFFNYFGSKEKIIELIVAESVEEFSDYVNDLLGKDDTDPIEAIRKTYRFLIKGIQNYYNISSVFFTLSIRDRDEDSVFKQLFTQYFEIQYRVIQFAQIKGCISDSYPPEIITKMFIGCLMNTLLCTNRHHFTDEFNKGFNSLIESLSV